MAVAVTLRDIAERAGVSVSMVSRVLDERLPPTRSEAAARVRQVAEELGYRRNLAASSLRRAATGTVGLLVPRLTDTVMAVLFEAVYAEASRRGLFAVVSVAGDDPARERTAAEALLARQVDGLVLATSRVDDDLPRDLRERGVPHVLALRTDGASPASLGDDELGGYLATRHLLDLGHRAIGLLAGPGFASTALGRRRGYERALREAGVPVDPALVVATTFGVESGEEHGARLLRADPRPTALFTVNDNLAVGAVSAATRLGLEVGRDVSVVGYNDIPIVSRMPVPLTTVRVPFDSIASKALDLLLHESGQEPGRTLLSAPTLIPRASTRPPLR